MKRIIMYGIIIFVFSFGIGYYYSKLWKSKNEIPSKIEASTKIENVIETTASIEEKISFDANFGLKKYYNECGHFKLNYVELPKEFINLTEKEIEEQYPKWRIEEFDAKNVVLAQNIDKYCEDHYVLMLGKRNIEIYKLLEAEEIELIKETNISCDYLTKEDIEKLKEGIFVYGIENLNLALEDYE